MPRRTLAEAAARIDALADTVPGPTHAALIEELDHSRNTADEMAARAHSETFDHADNLDDVVREGMQRLKRNLVGLSERATLAEESARALADELAEHRRTQRLLQ